MNHLFGLTNRQMAKLTPFIPKNAPRAYGPPKTLYSRWKRWSEKGIFARIMAGLAAEHGAEKTVMNEELSAVACGLSDRWRDLGDRPDGQLRATMATGPISPVGRS